MPQYFAGGGRSDSITRNKHLGEGWPSDVSKILCQIDLLSPSALETPGGDESWGVK